MESRIKHLIKESAAALALTGFTLSYYVGGFSVVLDNFTR